MKKLLSLALIALMSLCLGIATACGALKEEAAKYNVTFKNGETVLKTVEVEEGKLPAYDGETPTKEGDAQFSYEFTGWQPSIVKATEDATYTAKFEQKLNEYTITFKNWDGEVLQSGKLVYGATPSYDGEEPVRDGADGVNYGFTGFLPEITQVVGDAEYTAQFVDTASTFTVIWKNEGEVIETDEDVEWGEMPKYDGETPTKEPDVEFIYTFDKWDKELNVVKGDIVYNATYTKTTRKYTITFLDGEGGLLEAIEVEYGAMPEYDGEEPYKADDDAQYAYEFSGWTPEITLVNGEATYTATFDTVLRKYTIVFENENGDELQSSEVEYGKMPVYEGETPTKESDEQYNYSFAGWNNDVIAVDGEATYTAIYSTETRKYLIVFVDEDGNELQSGEVEYGAMPEYTGEIPEKAATEEKTYTFGGWTPDLSAVVGAETYTVKFDEHDYQVVTFITNNGTEIEPVTVAYGSSIPEPSEVLEKEGYDYYEWFNEGMKFYFDAPILNNAIIEVRWFKGVHSVEGFMAMDKDENYVLECDLDFSGVDFTPIQNYNGVFDGNGHTIKNISMTPSDAGGVAIFRNLAGTIQYLCLENITISSIWGGMIGNSALIAQNFSGGIYDCTLSGYVDGVAKIKTGWADYTGWDLNAGFVASSSSGGRIKDLVMDVDTSANSTVSLIAGKGTYYGDYVFILKHENNYTGSGATRLDKRGWLGTDTVEIMAPLMYDVFKRLSWWTVSETEMAYLNKDCMFNTSALITSYSIEYYFDGILDSSKTEIIVEKVGKEIELVAPEFSGYQLDIENTVSIITVSGDGSSAIKFCYTPSTVAVMIKDASGENVLYNGSIEVKGKFDESNLTIPEDKVAVYKDTDGKIFNVSNEITEDLVLFVDFYNPITTLTELRAINGSTDNYILLNDIDAENATFANTDFIPSFDGILEGNGYAIKNVKVKAGSRYWVAALFGTISGTVQNLKLENITICKSGDNTYTGKSAFMAGSITGTVKNIWITGTMEASTADTSSKDKRPAFIANNAAGGNVSNFLIEVANTVAGTYVVTGGTATHWGGVHAIGTANGWAGAGTRDLGVSISLNADASAVYNEAIKDLTDDVWTRDANTGVITMVKGFAVSGN